jgi:predicted aspartyl protease
MPPWLCRPSPLWRFYLQITRGTALSLRLALPLPLLLAATTPALADCQLMEVARLPVTISGTRPLVRGKLGGQPIKLLVDTGASRTTFDKATTDRLGVATEEASDWVGYGVGGRLRAFIGRFLDLEIGGMKVPEKRLMVNGSAAFEGFNGVIGYDLFQLVDLDLDMKNSRVGLYDPRGNCDGPLAHWNPDADDVPMTGTREQISFQVLIDGQPINAQLDTGASYTLLSWKAARRLGLSPGAAGVEVIGKTGGIDGRGMEMSRHKFQSFQIGTETIKNPTLLIADVFTAGQRETGSNIERKTEIDLLLGMDFLKAHHVFVSNKQRKVYFTYEGGEVFARQ